jgi:hypothetical protein
VNVKNRVVGRLFIIGQGKKLQNLEGWSIYWINVLLFGLIINSEAVIVTIDPGNVGTNTTYIQDFSVLNSLAGTVLNGQTQSVDIFFTNNEFLVAAGFDGFTIDLFINQDGSLGTWPANSCSVTGYLMDAAGNPLGSSVSFPDYGSMPAQIWSGWPFYLAGVIQYIPATKIYESRFFGSHVYGNPNGYYIKPITFSGVHFDIAYPNSPTNIVMGGRMVIAYFGGSIFISPNPMPQYSQYFVHIPNPRLTLTRTGPAGGSNSNTLNLRLAGTQNYPYILLSATNFTHQTDWQPFITNSADSNGNWNITITNVKSAPSEYFRAVAWPGVVQH